jgi:3-hydroxybutyryl-CoA dehydratase
MIDLDRLPYGREVRTAGRTLPEGELQLFHHLLGATDPIHTNADYAAKTIFGRTIAAGPVISGLVAIGWVRTSLYRELERDHGLVAVAGLSATIDYRAPFSGGDTLYGVYRLDKARRSTSRPGYYILTIGVRGENQRGEVLMEGTMTPLYRDTGPDDAEGVSRGRVD